MSSSQKSRKYSNPELREMIQQLVIAGHIDFDTRQRFMEALLHRYHVHHIRDKITHATTLLDSLCIHTQAVDCVVPETLPVRLSPSLFLSQPSPPEYFCGKDFGFSIFDCCQKYRLTFFRPETHGPGLRFCLSHVLEQRSS